MSLADDLIARAAQRDITFGIVGLGYVGLPLAVELARAGFQVLGYDVQLRVVDGLNAGRSHIKDVSDAEVAELLASGRFEATVDGARLREPDAISICVPTPLSKHKDPDVSFIKAATDAITTTLRRGQVVILESTTYPGTTREIVLPALESTGLTVGEDFFLAFSPERVDPGNAVYGTKNTPKIIGGITTDCQRVACAVYAPAIDTLVPVSSTEVAELVKLLENTFRSVNIGLVNELALMCDRLKVDVWEVIDAAATKPFGFMPFYPGPGLGGHCIPIDPFYLSWKARASGFEARFIELAGHVNSHMPEHVVERVSENLNLRGKAVNGSKVLMLGVAYKANIDDLRESPSLDIMETLRKKGAKIEYSDPFVPQFEFAGRKIKSVALTPATLKRYDCAVIATAHKTFPWSTILRYSKGVVDTRNALKGKKSSKITRL